MSSRLLLLAPSGAAANGLVVGGSPALATSSVTLEAPDPPTLTVGGSAPLPESSMVLAGGPTELSIGGSAPMARSAVLAVSNVTTSGGVVVDGGGSPVVDPVTGAPLPGPATQTVQVRAVTQTGSLVALVKANVIRRVTRAVNGQESAEGSIATLHPDAQVLDLFSHEVQVWIDGELYFWGRPARIDASRSGSSDDTTFVIDGLFSYFHDEVVGGPRPNHIVSPHEEPEGIVGGPPNYWTVTSKVEDCAVVDNNAEFWQQPVAIQINNSEAGEDAYMYQRFTVPGEFDGVPFEAMAYIYVGDDHAGAPAWGGPAYQQRGLTLARLEGGTAKHLGAMKIAQISDDLPRNTVQRLQTDSVLPKAGEILEVRCYAPDAWTVWRFVGLYDGRALKADRIDKTEALRMLAEHAQDTSVGKQDHNIDVSITAIGEPISREWPWHERANIGEELERLADTFEFEVAITPTTRTLRADRTVGTTRSWVLVKDDFHAWGLGAELGNAYSKVIGKGQGNGIAQDEWFANNPDALNSNVREKVWSAPPSTALAQLRDQTAHELEKVQAVVKLPRATISGERALAARPGDTVTVNLDHGSAQWTGAARCMSITLDPVARTADVALEPVTA